MNLKKAAILPLEYFFKPNAELRTAFTVATFDIKGHQSKY